METPVVAPAVGSGRQPLSLPTEAAFLVCTLLAAAALGWGVAGYLLAPLAVGDPLGGVREFGYLLEAVVVTALQMVLLGMFLALRWVVRRRDAGTSISRWWSLIAVAGPAIAVLVTAGSASDGELAAYWAATVSSTVLYAAAVAVTPRARLGARTALALRIAGTALALRIAGTALGTLIGVPAAVLLLLGGYTAL
ncbi:hypothetical protein [Demequina rhizosphaerae]|uniref:hypothetical protein n=1 Tax=Demequina rhizosphaerae TaxID=1638985 RepID=UPI0007807362|nr:hypothetical protein [Demequina rhizosphaerae]